MKAHRVGFEGKNLHLQHARKVDRVVADVCSHIDRYLRVEEALAEVVEELGLIETAGLPYHARDVVGLGGKAEPDRHPARANGLDMGLVHNASTASASFPSSLP